MATELEQVGTFFKRRREELELSLKACESATSIKQVFLEAIEEGEIRHHLSGIYAFGFMQQYGQFLGLDIESLQQQYPEVFSTGETLHDFPLGLGTFELRGSIGGGVKWVPSLFWALAIAGLLVCAYYFSRVIGVL